MAEKYLCVWKNDNPSVYVETCQNETELQKFMNELNEGAEEYPLYVIRGRDLAIAKVQGTSGQWTFHF